LSIVNFFYNHADPPMFTCEELIGALTLKNPGENMFAMWTTRPVNIRGSESKPTCIGYLHL